MQNFPGDLGDLLRDIPGFNRLYGTGPELSAMEWPALALEGLELRSARFDRVEFKNARFARSRFVDCAFTDCRLENVAFLECEFVNCEFMRCPLAKAAFAKCAFRGGAFKGGDFLDEHDGPGLTRFEAVEFHAFTFATLKMTYADFQACLFEDAIFSGVRMQKTAFWDSRFRRPRFEGGSGKSSQINRCEFDEPQGPELGFMGLFFSETLIRRAVVAPVSTPEHPHWSAYGAVFVDSTFDLSRMLGNFGIDGAKDSALAGLNSQNALTIAGRYKNVSFRDMQANRIDLDMGLECENCRFENLGGDYVFMQDAKFRNTTFDGFEARTAVILDGADLSGATFTNSKVGANVTYRAEGTPYETQRPF